jgi:hypothetical protein
MHEKFFPSCNTFTDATDPASEQTDEQDWIFVAIRDVEHDRQVSVGSTQHHDNADLGLWQATYPDIGGGATAEFDSHNILFEMDCQNLQGAEGYADHDPHLISTW